MVTTYIISLTEINMLFEMKSLMFRDYDNCVEHQSIENMFMSLQDGVVLGPPGVPRTKRNFVTPLKDTTLADQFVRHFFTLYDGDSRMKLGGMYHGDALFSLTSTYLPAQSTSNTAR
jgi:hypothetical protein